VIKDNVLSGCIFYGDVSGYRKVLTAIETKKDVGDIRDRLERWDLGGL
jgi:NAD(P)H-nitrite reductase large subunit